MHEVSNRNSQTNELNKDYWNHVHLGEVEEVWDDPIQPLP